MFKIQLGLGIKKCPGYSNKELKYIKCYYPIGLLYGRK